MPGKIRAWVAFTLLLLCTLSVVVTDTVEGGGYFLVDGVGLEGKLEIGGPAPKNASQVAENLFRLNKTPLYFKMAEGRVALIRCEEFCLTNRNVSIGSTEKEVLLRYGPPRKRKKLSGSQFLEYPGVGFSMNKESNAVEAIYIFPVFRSATGKSRK